MATAGKFVHFLEGCADLPPHSQVKTDNLPTPDLSIEQGSLRNIAAKHFLQTHCLTAQLQTIRIQVFGFASLIFHGIGLPQAIVTFHRDSDIAAQKFQDITLPADPQLR